MTTATVPLPFKGLGGNMTMVTGGDKPCYAVPKVNGRYVSLGDIFNLYSNEWGKPRELILLYQHSELIDLVVLQWMRDVNGKPMPKYMGTLFSDTASPSPNIWDLESETVEEYDARVHD